ncbi:ExeA family protein [Burkholderia sp. MSMB1498]|uniref:ExeA family protein n=1 Tax=Burkholderia sp. MSMB1498 TaxID=1637842 RepID=UPI000A7F4A10|nr:AAA family ATPase [Burkholderia sp. MSMB1498]
MMLKLKNVLQRIGCKQADLAAHIGLSQATVAQIVNHGAWPKSFNADALRRRILDYLRQRGVLEAALADAFDSASDSMRDGMAGHAAAGAAFSSCNSSRNSSHFSSHASSRRSPRDDTDLNQEDSMLLRKQALTPAARKHFGLFRDPFQDDVRSHDDMYLSPDIRHVREAMFQTAKHGGMLAVVAESGAGKTTLMRDLEDRITRENQPVLLIKPYVLAMEDSDRKGKTLKATHIAEAIVTAVAPLEKLRSSPQARFAQLHRALEDSHAAGGRHCLVIDEAHALPIATLKHLKRFFELESGFAKLLSIVLIGQPELKIKLSERNQDVREIVQRCEMIELPPLDRARLDEYLAFKLGRLDKRVGDVIDAGGVDALRGRLTIASDRRRERADTISLLYPLAVGNLLTAAMNLAAGLGVPVVTADVIKGI